MARKILHVDLDAFFCSVEELLHPDLKGKAFVVGGTPEGRGVVSSASYAARAFGIHSAMPTAMALRRCPTLIVLSSTHRTYSRFSRQVMDILKESAPLVEQISIDEAFLDASDDPRRGVDIAASVKERILAETALPTSWGIATSKLVAKIATEVGKPDGIIEVAAGEEAAFLAPLPVDMLWGVGPKTRERLAEEGIRTIGGLAAMTSGRLQKLFGEHGLELASRAVGDDSREVVSTRRVKSISAERTFAEDVLDPTTVSRMLLMLAEDVGQRLRKQNLAASTVRLKLRWPDFQTQSRQVRLEHPTNVDEELFQTGKRLLSEFWSGKRAIRLIGIAAADLGAPIRQLELFDHAWQEQERLMSAIDEIRQRYGQDAVWRGDRRKHEQPSPDKDA